MWRVERHPRFLADLTGDGCADLVGFGDDGVWVALNGYDLRLMSVTAADDLVNEGRNLVIVALVGTDLHIRIFDASGEKVIDKAEAQLVSGETLTALKKRLNPLPNESALSKEQKQKFIRDATSIADHTPLNFQEPKFVIANFGYNAGGWRVENHPRFLADLTDDGCADIVGFGDDGVWVALNNGDGTFQAPQLVVANFGYNAGVWRVERHPRFLADLTGDGCADIVGFGDDGVWIALNNGDGTFQEPRFVIANFGYNAGGWRVERHPRFLADRTGDGRADIVGFGNAGVWVSFNNGDGTFQTPQLVVENFGYNAGGWRGE